MNRFVACGLLVTFLVMGAPRTLRAAEPDRLADEQLLRTAALATDGPKLLDFFRKRASKTADRAQVRSLVAQLSDESLDKREKAVGELIALGTATLPDLREATRDIDDRDLNARTKRCLDFIEGPSSIPLVLAATRLMAHRHPDGGVEALLLFLPMAENDNVLEQLKKTLLELALRDGKPEPALVSALQDKLSVRRAMAAEVLSQVGRNVPDADLRKLLKDPVPTVRLRVALALAQGQNEEAIAELIQLLGELAPAQAKQAEEFLFELAQDQSPQAPLGNDEESRKKSRDAWAAWWKSTEGEGLLEEFRKRTLTDADRDKALALIEKLGDNSFEEREKATADLAKLNYKIAPLLRVAMGSSDLEVRSRAEKCLQAVETGKDRLPPLSAVTARLVGLRKPAGAAEALLAFLATVDDEPAIDEVQTVLAAIAIRKDTPEPVLVKALTDKQARRRGAAAAALVYAGASEHFPAIRKMLQDEDKPLRLEVALALAAAREKEAVPVLIGLLADLNPNQAARIEEYLRLVAGDKSPIVSLGSDEKERKKCHDAWASWWKENEKTVTLVSVNRQSARGILGYTMVLLPDMQQILELGIDGKVRWQIQGVINPFAAQSLPGDRVLVAEYGAGRVTERSSKGEILWEKRIQGPVGCQRLPNGNTFIVTLNNMVEVDRNGQELFSRPANGFNYFSATKLRNGQIMALNSNSVCQVLDGTGKEIKQIRVPAMNYNCMEVLPNGHLLIVQIHNNKVIEYDQEAKPVWEANVAQPTHASRLPNGNTLVSTQYPGKVVELDRTGKQVWEYAAPNQTRIQDARRR